MRTLYRKLNTLIQGIRTKGLRGFVNYLLFESDNIYVGYWVVLFGNKVKIDNNLIYLDNPLIPVERKSQFLQGRFEQPERNAVKHFLDPSIPAIELGGSVGVVACLTNKILHDPQKHIVVEAHPLFAQTLLKNKIANAAKFTIIQKAISYDQGDVRFGGADFSNRVAPHYGTITVPTTTLTSILQDHDWSKLTLICDIEGSEIELFQNEKALIKDRVKTIIVELHPDVSGETAMETALHSLEQLGFSVMHHEANVYVLVQSHDND